ncbi:MAG: hypothetical protein U0R26_07730 [Solirubrobacterales bacterium]
MRLAGRVGILREPNYRRLCWGRTISLVGDGVAPVAMAFAILDLTGSATDLGIVLAGHSLLITALVLVGGVFAEGGLAPPGDAASGPVRMVAMGASAALLIGGVAQVWELALLYGVEGAATAFFNPASIAIVPPIVRGPRLQEANALLNLSRSAGKVAGRRWPGYRSPSAPPAGRWQWTP